MFKRKTPSMRAGFLVIAISLAITTTILGMSAYLTDTDEYTSTFRTATGNELGFKITGTNYKNEAIIPGDTVYLNSAAVIEKENDLYVFVEIDVPSDFTVHGFDKAIWRPISNDSNIYVPISPSCFWVSRACGLLSRILFRLCSTGRLRLF